MSALAGALAEFQAELPKVGKDKTAKVKSDKANYEYDYADLTVITDAAFPVLSKHGLSFSCLPTSTDHGFVLTFALLHKDGERIDGSYPLPDPARSTPQQIGSAITYGRRYCLCAVTGIAPSDSDDDGQAAADARARDPKAAPPVETDALWFADLQARLDKAANTTETEALSVEARKGYRDGKLAKPDADRWAELVANRNTELGAST